jgi:hypothetical protein
VLRGTNLQGAVRLFRQIADGDGSHDCTSLQTISMPSSYGI